MDHKTYLLEVVPQLLTSLDARAEPSFGVMTPHHMIEHLIWVTKSSVKDFGPPPAEPSSGQLKFKKFIEDGAHFKYYPKDVKREDLDPPRTASLAEAIVIVPDAIRRIYNFKPGHVFYNPIMGVLTLEEVELFHAQHFKHHLEAQFGLEV